MNMRPKRETPGFRDALQHSMMWNERVAYSIKLECAKRYIHRESNAATLSYPLKYDIFKFDILMKINTRLIIFSVFFGYFQIES